MGEKKTGPHTQWTETTQSTIAPPPAVIPAPPHPIDESPDLHDPYSELNLFLTRKIKEEFKTAGTTKKWSIYVQEKLIEKITPEFKKKFPHYRLGVSALKKVWEKFSYFSKLSKLKKRP